MWETWRGEGVRQEGRENGRALKTQGLGPEGLLFSNVLEPHGSRERYVFYFLVPTLSG